MRSRRHARPENCKAWQQDCIGIRSNTASPNILAELLIPKVTGAVSATVLGTAV